MELAKSNTVAVVFCGALAGVRGGGAGLTNCISSLETGRKGHCGQKRKG